MSKITLLSMLTAAVTGAVVLLSGPVANSQSRKKDQAAQPSAGHQPCKGLLWIGTQCQLPDGRVCEVAEGSSGSAILRDCK